MSLFLACDCESPYLVRFFRSDNLYLVSNQNPEKLLVTVNLT